MAASEEPGSKECQSGWDDPECFALSTELYSRSDADFDGFVSFEETLAMRRRLLEELEVEDSELLESNPPRERAESRATVKMESWSTILSSLCRSVGAERFKAAARKILTEPCPGPPKLVVGPVIGKVTDTSARILVESSRDVTVTCCVTPARGISEPACPIEWPLVRGRPQVLTVGNLRPGTLYEVTFEGVEVLVDSCRFCTLPAGGWRLDGGAAPRFVVCSCNSIYTTRTLPVGSRGDLWQDLETRIRKGLKVDYMVHLGDNVYNDSDWHLIEKGKKPLEGKSCKWGVAREWLLAIGDSSEQWLAQKEEVTELFRNVYRETWGHPPTRWVLANIPNLMIFDDHDIRDDWGDRDEDSKLDSLDRFLGEIAYDLINEYQRQLYEDIPTRPTRDFHLHTFGDIGFAFLDVRGCKTFHRQPEDQAAPMLGVEQWRVLESSLRPAPAEEPESGMFEQCKALFIFAPEPVAYVSHTPTMIAGRHICDDLLGQWSATYHRGEVPRLLRLLCEWKEGSPERDVIVIGGDVHEGGWTDLICRDSKSGSERARLRQLTTSAISNTMTKAHEAAAVTLTRDVASAVDRFDLGGGWHYRHYDWTNRRNYALIDVSQERCEGVALPVSLSSRQVNSTPSQRSCRRLAGPQRVKSDNMVPGSSREGLMESTGMESTGSESSFAASGVPLRAVIGGQLVASNGVEVEVLKRRTTGDPIITCGKSLKGLSNELCRHSRGMIAQCVGGAVLRCSLSWSSPVCRGSRKAESPERLQRA